MRDWTKIIKTFHEWSHKDDEWELVTSLPASGEQIAEFEASVGFKLPEEFVGLYQTYNGVSIVAGDERCNFFVALGDLPKHFSEVREWFEGTHPKFAKRFFPFVDWGSGDSTGYMLNERGEPLPGLYNFEHEDYEFDEGQDPNDFLPSVYDSIEDLLATD
jgi:hypothetical protein